MLNIGIKGMGTALPKNFAEYSGGRRYRISGDETHIGMLCESAENALKNSSMTIDDIDVIIGACAVGVQPIPCTAAMIHEVIAKGRCIPAFDVNSTCTSFITALDIVSGFIQSGRYKNALIVSGDVASVALNESERHSYELFSDGAVSAVIGADENGGILFSKQITYSAGAHMTEIIGGGSRLPVFEFTRDNEHMYKFHMEGKDALVMTMSLMDGVMSDIEKESGIGIEDIDMIIPHQASAALSLIMKRLNVPEGKYINIVHKYGNMVSASVPFALDYAVRQGLVKRGDVIMLLGTAAGLTIGAVILRY